MINESAIKRIEQLSSASLTRPDTFTPTVVLPGDCSVHSLEKFQERPVRQRAKFATERLKDFCDYVGRESDLDHTAVFIEPDGSGATAVLDFGDCETPMWKEHRAALKMKYTPEFQAVMSLCRRPVDQRELTDFLEDWHHLARPEADGEIIPVNAAITAIRAVTISNIREATTEVADFEASASALSKISAKSKAGKLPGKLVIPCRLYPHTKKFEVCCRVSILTGESSPTFSVRIIGLESMQVEVAEEVELEIGSALKGKARIYVGEIGA